MLFIDTSSFTVYEAPYQHQTSHIQVHGWLMTNDDVIRQFRNTIIPYAVLSENSLRLYFMKPGRILNHVGGRAESLGSTMFKVANLTNGLLPTINW